MNTFLSNWQFVIKDYEILIFSVDQWQGSALTYLNSLAVPVESYVVATWLGQTAGHLTGADRQYTHILLISMTTGSVWVHLKTQMILIKQTGKKKNVNRYFNSYPADHNYCRFQSVLLVNELLWMHEIMCV